MPESLIARDRDACSAALVAFLASGLEFLSGFGAHVCLKVRGVGFIGFVSAKPETLL